jgi:hypothetical protein
MQKSIPLRPAYLSYTKALPSYDVATKANSYLKARHHRTKSKRSMTLTDPSLRCPIITQPYHHFWPEAVCSTRPEQRRSKFADYIEAGNDNGFTIIGLRQGARLIHPHCLDATRYQ